MIVCNKCGKENQEHYKFCLGCGSEIVQRVAPKPTPPMIVDDAPEITNSGVVPEASDAPIAETASGAIHCPKCKTINPVSFAFCGGCGIRLKQSGSSSHPQVRPAPDSINAAIVSVQSLPKTDPSIVRLALIRPDGSEGGTFMVTESTSIIGRNSESLFANDNYLSPAHVKLSLTDHLIHVEDLDSLNGVFLRIRGEEPLQDGDLFRIGQELLRFDRISDPHPEPDGTQVLGSPNPGFWGRICLVVNRNTDGNAFPLLANTITLGREKGDIIFSDDGYVSGVHAKIVNTLDGKTQLIDLNSSNGTFIRLRKPRRIPFGSFMLVGQQLFRLDSP